MAPSTPNQSNRESPIWTNEHNSWRRFIVAQAEVVASLHEKIILATTVHSLGEVIRLRVRLLPTASLVTVDRSPSNDNDEMHCTAKSQQLELFRLNEVKTLLFRDRLLVTYLGVVHRRLRLDALTRLWLAARL